MIIGDQSETIAFLMRPVTFGITTPVETIETHISRIFLAGARVFKMKRAVRLPYVDFSLPELRLTTCLREVALNSRTAPGLYLGVRRITREADGRLAFDGEGVLVDAVVEMTRFDQHDLLDDMASAGTLTPDLMTRTARVIARFHGEAPVIQSGGGRASLEGVLAINRAGFAVSHVFTAAEVAALDAACRAALLRHGLGLDRRAEAGMLRRCHGDLHLRNICLIDGEPALFDCIEFNDQIATVDVLYDLAFLLMDLWHRGLPDHANLVMNRYLDATENDDGFVLLPLFLAVRAAVRAHVTATQVEENGDPSGALTSVARAYFDLANDLLVDRPARLIVIGGLSGSGKTTVADALAPRVGSAPGARIVESDRIRKSLHGQAAEAHLPDTAYHAEMSAIVYREMASRTGRILADGGSVVADAVFDRAENRDAMEAVAAGAKRPFLGIWLRAAPDLLRDRVERRIGGPSDATVAILSRQLERDAGDISWHRIEANQPASAVVAQILALPAV